jgi:hypothetical protein
LTVAVMVLISAVVWRSSRSRQPLAFVSPGWTRMLLLPVRGEVHDLAGDCGLPLHVAHRDGAVKAEDCALGTYQDGHTEPTRKRRRRGRQKGTKPD